jgi:hypothetical protein
MSEEARYEGRPFLRLLDCYVLRAIGQLDEAQNAALQTIEPQLAGVYGKESRWFEVVAEQMDFPDGIEASINQVWQATLLKAEELNMEVNSAEFTRQFVDTNFQ